jgi:DNA repair protein SbcD/Mre11
VKFLHAADIHLDSPLRGLDRYEGAPVDEIRNATRRALENLVALAIDEEVNFVILAGDLFDGDWPDFNTGLFFVRQMARLADRNISVYAVRGNHDAESKITRKLPWPRNVHFFSSRKPESLVVESCDAVLHGQSFAGRDVKEDLAAAYPSAAPGKINIGVLHTSLDGREGHAGYAPTKIDVLRSRGYDYWALGHVHKREIVHREPLVVFPGNLQGRHIKEAGDKGCQLVTLESGGLRAEHRPLDVFRWAGVTVDIESAASLDDVLESSASHFDKVLADADGRPVAVRVRLVGRGPAHQLLAAKPETVRNQLRATAIERGKGAIWLEGIEIATGATVDLQALKERNDPVGELLSQFDAAKAGDDGLLSVLEAELQGLKQKLPAELVEAEDGVRLTDATYLGRILGEAESQLAPRLTALGEDA